MGIFHTITIFSTMNEMQPTGLHHRQLPIYSSRYILSRTYTYQAISNKLTSISDMAIISGVPITANRFKGFQIVKYIKLIVSIIIILNTNFVISQNFTDEYGRKQGFWSTVDKENDLYHYEVNYLNDTLHGPYLKYFTPENTLVIKGNFQNGKKEGDFYEYFLNGDINAHYIFKNDKREGPQYWFVDNKISTILPYRNDVLDGTLIGLDSKGKINLKREIIKGVSIDTVFFFDELERPVAFKTHYFGASIWVKTDKNFKPIRIWNFNKCTFANEIEIIGDRKNKKNRKDAFVIYLKERDKNNLNKQIIIKIDKEGNIKDNRCPCEVL